jgi:iron complex transport system substrate-binding protein
MKMKINKICQSRIIAWFCQSLLVALLVIGCQSTETTISNFSESPAATTISADAKVTQGCVPTYNPNTDYFPDKVSISYATGFEVGYHKNYKIITVKNPWRNADTTFQYVLVQCGTPAPKGYTETQIIEIPISTVVSVSTTHLPHLEKLGVVDKLVGVSDKKQINTASVVEKIKAGQIVEIGSGANINLEKLLELNPDLITTYGVGNPEIDSYPKLIEAGLKVAINSEYMESSPLGRAEWLKFTALFFNEERKASQIFEQIAQQYQTIAEQAKAVKNPPTVFVGFNFKGIWYMPGGDSYVAQYLADAGANYLWKENKSSGNLPLSFEQVYERAANADYWLNLSQTVNTYQDLLAQDNRYSEFKAVKNINLYNNNALINPTGGNDYWESGISNPHLILSDLIKIFHPQILPNHQLKYYRKLT